ncbi:MAG: hypothetical protein HWN65_16415 [Candidatus Helarchaeota archaeon]|nr:hypothetical protein [Candidatus Helarchaeota archaeon]
MKNVIIPFIPTIDENDGRLVYVAEPFIRLKYFEKVIVIMPYEFSISLEDEEGIQKRDASKIVKLTFWDLLETFSVLNIALNFIIYHESEIDEIGKHLEGIANKFWGVSTDHVLDTIFISRELYHWLEEQRESKETDKKLFQDNLYREYLNFHKRNGIVGIDENDEVERVFFERALLLRKQQHVKRNRIQATIEGVADLFEREAFKKAERFWEQKLKEGKILYYPPDELPIL